MHFKVCPTSSCLVPGAKLWTTNCSHSVANGWDHMVRFAHVVLTVARLTQKAYILANELDHLRTITPSSQSYVYDRFPEDGEEFHVSCSVR